MNRGGEAGPDDGKLETAATTMLSVDEKLVTLLLLVSGRII